MQPPKQWNIIVCIIQALFFILTPGAEYLPATTLYKMVIANKISSWTHPTFIFQWMLLVYFHQLLSGSCRFAVEIGWCVSVAQSVDSDSSESKPYSWMPPAFIIYIFDITHFRLRRNCETGEWHATIWSRTGRGLIDSVHHCQTSTSYIRTVPYCGSCIHQWGQKFGAPGFLRACLVATISS